ARRAKLPPPGPPRTRRTRRLPGRASGAPIAAPRTRRRAPRGPPPAIPPMPPPGPRACRSSPWVRPDDAHRWTIETETAHGPGGELEDAPRRGAAAHPTGRHVGASADDAAAPVDKRQVDRGAHPERVHEATRADPERVPIRDR